MSAVGALARVEAKRIIRDPLMLYVTGMPLVMALALRFGLPPLGVALRKYVTLETYYPLIQGVLAVYVPMVFGFVAGFMLLDDRDEHILMAVAVTPLRQRGYVGFRLQAITVLGFVINLIAAPLAGLASINYLSFLPLALLAALQGPLIALFLAGFASNKVEGLALGKLITFFTAGCFIGYFAAWPWQLLGGVFPSYWISQAFLVSSEPGLSYWLYLAGGVAVHLGIGTVLLRHFIRSLR